MSKILEMKGLLEPSLNAYGKPHTVTFDSEETDKKLVHVLFKTTVNSREAIDAKLKPDEVDLISDLFRDVREALYAERDTLPVTRPELEVLQNVGRSAVSYTHLTLPTKRIV